MVSGREKNRAGSLSLEYGLSHGELSLFLAWISHIK